MSRYAPEPASARGRDPRTAVLLVNLGTPDEPTAPALRRYLAEFLADPRVVEIPRTLWWPILKFAILPTRPAKSAAKYATIWTPEGSPLAVWTAAMRRARFSRSFASPPSSGTKKRIHSFFVKYTTRSVS